MAHLRQESRRAFGIRHGGEECLTVLIRDDLVGVRELGVLQILPKGDKKFLRTEQLRHERRHHRLEACGDNLLLGRAHDLRQLAAGDDLRVSLAAFVGVVTVDVGNHLVQHRDNSGRVDVADHEGCDDRSRLLNLHEPGRGPGCAGEVARAQHIPVEAGGVIGQLADGIKQGDDLADEIGKRHRLNGGTLLGGLAERIGIAEKHLAGRKGERAGAVGIDKARIIVDHQRHEPGELKLLLESGHRDIHKRLAVVDLRSGGPAEELGRVAVEACLSHGAPDGGVAHLGVNDPPRQHDRLCLVIGFRIDLPHAVRVDSLLLQLFPRR